MKKIVVLMLLAAIVCMPCAAFAQASQTSEFERFLAEHNLTIPQVFADESGAEDFYYWVMDILREDPYHILHSVITIIKSFPNKFSKHIWMKIISVPYLISMQALISGIC